MNNYKGLKKACPQFLRTYELTKRNLESQSIQIQNFKQDINNKLIPTDSVFYYLELDTTYKVYVDLYAILHIDLSFHSYICHISKFCFCNE